MWLPALLALTLALPAPAAARDGCASPVASMCAEPSQAQPSFRSIRIAPRTPPFAPGDAFPLAEHSPLLDPARYDLPPAGDGWRYYRVRPWVLRVDIATGRVIEVVTGGNRRMLR